MIYWLFKATKLELWTFYKRPQHLLFALIFALVMTALFAQTFETQIFYHRHNIFAVLLIIQLFCFLIILQNPVRNQSMLMKLFIMNAPNSAIIFATKVLSIWLIMTGFFLIFLPLFHVLLVPIHISSSEYLVIMSILIIMNIAFSCIGIIMDAIVHAHHQRGILLSISLLPLFLPLIIPAANIIRQLSVASSFVAFELTALLPLAFIVTVYLLATLYLFEHLINEV